MQLTCSLVQVGQFQMSRTFHCLLGNTKKNLFTANVNTVDSSYNDAIGCQNADVILNLMLRSNPIRE